MEQKEKSLLKEKRRPSFIRLLLLSDWKFFRGLNTRGLCCYCCYLKSFSRLLSAVVCTHSHTLTHTHTHSHTLTHTLPQLTIVQSEPTTWRMRNLWGSTSNKLQCNKAQQSGGNKRRV